MKLQTQWAMLCKLRAEGAELCAEGDKLRDEGYKLREKGVMQFAEAVFDVFGPVKIEWIYRNGGYDCRLENGEVYKHDEVVKLD